MQKKISGEPELNFRSMFRVFENDIGGRTKWKIEITWAKIVFMSVKMRGYNINPTNSQTKRKYESLNQPRNMSRLKLV